MDQVAASLRRDLLALRPKMPHNPRRKIVFTLVAEFHQYGIFLDGVPEPFHPFIRLEGQRAVSQNEAAILRQLRQKLRDLISLLLRQLKQIGIVHMDERAFRHHRNRFNAVIEKLRGQILLRQTVIVKVLRQLVQKLLFQHREVMAAQIVLFAVKDIEIPRLFLRKVIFQLCKPIGSSFRLFCHGLPRNHNVSGFIRAQQ